MKYRIEALNLNTNDSVIAEINCRADAKEKTLVQKCGIAIAQLLNWGIVHFYCERPNIWTNGGLGYLTINNGGDNWQLFVSRTDNHILIYG